MKKFKLRTGKNQVYSLTKEVYEKVTLLRKPYRQQEKDGSTHYFAVCPACDNPIQIIGLYAKTDSTPGALLLGGLLIGRIKEIAVAILSFCSMRKVAGGYHADSSIKCFIYSSSFILGSAYAPQIISKYPIWVFGIIPVFYGFFSPNFIHEELNMLTQKRKCMFLLFLLLGIAFVSSTYWQTIILTGMLFEGLTLLRRKELN